MTRNVESQNDHEHGDLPQQQWEALWKEGFGPRSQMLHIGSGLEDVILPGAESVKLNVKTETDSASYLVENDWSADVVDVVVKKSGPYDGQEKDVYLVAGEPQPNLRLSRGRSHTYHPSAIPDKGERMNHNRETEIEYEDSGRPA